MTTVQQLGHELEQHKQHLHQLQRQLAAAEAYFLRHRGDGAEITTLREQIHLAELRVRGCEIDIERARQPQPVSWFSRDPAAIRREIEGIERARAYRHRVHNEAVEQERRTMRGQPEEYVRVHVRNIFGSTERQRREADAADERRLTDLRRQLELLTQPEPPRAA